MNKDEKLKKACDDFSKLNDKQQDYILGILQALVFAKNDGTMDNLAPLPNPDKKKD